MAFFDHGRCATCMVHWLAPLLTRDGHVPPGTPLQYLSRNLVFIQYLPYPSTGCLCLMLICMPNSGHWEIAV